MEKVEISGQDAQIGEHDEDEAVSEVSQLVSPWLYDVITLYDRHCMVKVVSYFFWDAFFMLHFPGYSCSFINFQTFGRYMYASAKSVCMIIKTFNKV